MIPPDDKPLYDIWLSHFPLGVITAAVSLGFFENIEKTHPTTTELAEILQIPKVGCKVIVDVLISLDFLTKKQEKLQNTETAKVYFLENSPFYWGSTLEAWGNLLHTNYVNLEHGLIIDKLKNLNKEKYQLRQNLHGKNLKLFFKQMHAQILPSAIFNANLECFNRAKKVLDIGGGSGAFCMQFSEKYPDKEITLYELAEVCTIAQEFIEKYGNPQKTKTMDGNFLTEDLPKGYDTLFFSNILHNWSDENRQMLAKKSFDALPAGGHIVAQEMLLNEENPLTISLFNLLMYLYHDVELFTEKQIFDLFKQAGFSECQRLPGFGYYSIVIAKK